MIVGDKSVFAVEYDFAQNYPQNMGYGKIWVRSKFIGTNKDLIYLSSYLLGTLHQLKNSHQLTDDLKRLKAGELYKRLITDESWKYRVSSTTFIDDFCIFCFQIDAETYVLWKLIGDNGFQDLQGYDRDIQIEKISTYILEQVVGEIQNRFRAIGI